MIHCVYNWILSLCLNRKQSTAQSHFSGILQFVFYKEMASPGEIQWRNEVYRVELGS